MRYGLWSPVTAISPGTSGAAGPAWAIWASEMAAAIAASAVMSRRRMSADLVGDGDQVLGLHVQAAVGRLVAALRQREDLRAAVLPAALGDEALARLHGRP